MNRLMEKSRSWGATAEELTAHYPCHDHAREPYRTFVRAVDVGADTATVFRWLCQLKVAPYSYDLIDNPGRRSPRELTPGAEELAVGQRLLIGRIVEFEYDAQITLVSGRRSDLVFGGPIALTYQVGPAGDGRSRLVACMAVTANSWPARMRRTALGFGDLVMMRKQLLTLKACAEASRPTRDRKR